MGPLPHPCSLGETRDMISRGELTVMDCAPVLASGPINEKTVKELVTLAKQRGTALLLYDTFANRPWNSTIVRWMGEALQN